MRVAAAAILVALAGCASAAPVLVLGTTTTLQDTGLLDVLVPAFERDEGVRARAVVGGTGEILEKARRGDVDVLLTHSPQREEAGLADGWIASRRVVMSSRFVVAGPDADPAGVAGAANASDALRRVHANASIFASRGDRSGTHDKELELWARAGLDPAAFPASWYKETGSGQGPTLLFAAERDAYLLVDDATLLRYHSQGLATGIRGYRLDDPLLRNEYAVSLLDGARVPGADGELATAFADWIVGTRGRAVIASYAVAGQPLFAPEGPP